MIVLGLDTATRATAVALWNTPNRTAARPAGKSSWEPSGALLAERRDDPPAGGRPGHAAQLLPLAAAALDTAQIGWDEVDRIAVGVGPGTFTGLRIGIATARALSQARGIGLVGVSTLQSLALLAAPAARALGIDRVAGVIDARRGELFAAAWTVAEVADPAAVPAFGPQPYRPEALEEAIGAPLLAVGDGAIAARAALERAGAHVPPEDSELHLASAAGHCRLGAALARGSAALQDVAPTYLRVPDAELTRRARVAAGEDGSR